MADNKSAIEELQRTQAALRESEERLQAIIQSAMDAILTVDEEQRIVMFNAAAEKMFGCPAEEAIGQSIEPFIPQRFHAAHRAHIRRFSDTGVTNRALRPTNTNTLWAVRSSGEEFPIEASISQIETSSKKLFTVIIRDITERKQAEDALHESERRYRLLFGEMVVGFALLEVIYNENGKLCDHRYLEVNPAFETHTGLARDKVLGKTIREVLPGIEPFWIETYGKVATTGESVHFENYAQPLQKWFEVTAFRTQQGQLGVTFADVTERKRAEEELAKKVDELARSNADLEQFAYVASHDLQEPLRMVTAYTQLLAERYRGQLDENADKFIGYASEGAQRMQVLIKDLLSFSRIGRNGFSKGSVDSNVVVEEVLQTLAPAIRESSAVVTHTELPSVWADRTQMAQVFQNLIGNAIKFRQKEPPVVSLQAEKAGQNWQFSVSDNGIGIPPEHTESIFVVFHRLHARTEYPGNGIGLAICKKIIERGGGKIWVESQAGSGSTFKFTMPLHGPEERKGMHP